MSEVTDSSAGDGGPDDVTVRCVVPVRGLTSSQVVRAVRTSLMGRPCAGISVAIVDDATIGSLHARFLDDPSPTDVLTFDLRDDPDAEVIEGEIVVSADTARRQAREYGESELREVLRYIVHGTLHLMGYDDHTPAARKRMRREEDRILAELDASRRTTVRSGRRGSRTE